MTSEKQLPSIEDEIEGEPEMDRSDRADPLEIAEKITGDRFEEWYADREFAENIKSGQSYFNGPSKFKKPGKFNPSELLNCHRKTYYKKLNAPKEQEAPNAIFYIGSLIEEQLVEEFISDEVTDEETYQQNDIWVNFSIPSDLGDLEVNGSTDPVIVDENGSAILPTEIKTTSDTEYLDGPKETHKAQAHAYMIGLSQKYDRMIDRAVLMYIGRSNQFDPVRYLLDFDKQFWQNRVIEWMKKNAYYHTFGKLPPAQPERDWECDYCDFKNRCGKGEDFYQNEGPVGFLPVFEYPQTRVKEYLEEHESAKLTPTLAHQHPELTDGYDVYNWQCDTCESTFKWDEINWKMGEKPPKCPDCRPDNEYLKGPNPEEQYKTATDLQEVGE